MKTLEEIKAHLSMTVYDEYSKQKIAGFIIGKEVKKGRNSLSLDFATPKNFDYFKEWFDDPSNNYFQRKDSIINDGKDVFEDEFKNEKPKLKAKAYQDGKWFDVTFDEICGQLKIFNPVVCDGVIPDDILDKIFKEISGEEEPRYKYIGKERENLIKRKELLIDIIEDNEKKNKEIAIANPFISKMINFFNDSYKKEIKNIDDKLRETVD
jgi:hypothetical protein